MPVDLNRLTDGWLQLESDPGLFTLLLEDFGVKGVQVEEIYDLQKSFEGPAYGFIFLFKWIEERRSRRKVVVQEESFVEHEETVNSIFFAQQIVPNSCATHALLSVLLNCSKIHLGSTLTRLKDYTANMSPENKGHAIGNTPELARAHNSHAKPEPRHLQEKSHGISTGRTIDAFHFVSYVPINGRLFELDGLKPYPIDHGPWSEGEDWTEKFRRVITERLGIATGGEPYHDIRFNLMAVVPDRRIAYEQKLKTLKTNRQIILEALQQLVKITHPELTSEENNHYMAANIDQHDVDGQPGTASSQPFPKLPPALDNHNYAKSPLMEGVFSGSGEERPRYEEYSSSDYSDEEEEEEEAAAKHTLKSCHQHHTHPPRSSCEPVLRPLSINTSPELMKPLSIQTKFQASPTPSASSTDTASDAGSAFNSPVRNIHSSPGGRVYKGQECSSVLDDVKDIKRFVVIRVTNKKDSGEGTKNEDGDLSRIALSQEIKEHGKVKVQQIMDYSHEGKKLNLVEPHAFAPKDLLALLKTVENEISVCESNLKDEIEKRKKYTIDDSRRTHNYDQFICTFLSMLAEQGKLADLVEQQLQVRRRPGEHVGRLLKARKPDRRRKTRGKRRR